MPPVEAWRKVYIDETFFGVEEIHNRYTCVECHGGTNSPDFEVAHAEVVRDPSDQEPNVCDQCHRNVAQYQMGSLHYSLRGEDHAVYTRSAPEHYGTIEHMQENHCNGCHTTCGQCHISQPTSAGGGLLEGHVFQKTPPMGRTCTGCHGSRVGNEYTGAHEGLPADVHIRTERMSCTDCHTAGEMHGDGPEAEALWRYDGPENPSCESADCHTGILEPEAEIAAHAAHRPDQLACQVCHSQVYENCWSCHTELSEEEEPYFKVDWNHLTLMIGRNPIQTEHRPYEYVLLRHVPAAPEAFDTYGENLLPNFSERPTWLYTTPHNIVRVAPQAKRCENCHENDAVFLTEDKIIPPAAEDAFADEPMPASLDPSLYIEANQGVIVEGAPPLPAGYEPLPEEEPAEEEEEENVEELFE